MSFSSLTKNELARVSEGRRCCQLAELAALARLDGTIQITERRVSFKMVNENAAVARKIFRLVKQNFGIKAEVLVRRKIKLRKNNVYMVRVPPSPETWDMLVSLGLMDNQGNIPEAVNPDFLRRTCCRRAYLRGAFLGGGSVNSPQGNYHLEIISNNEGHALDICKLLRKFKLDAKVSARKNWHVVYLKDSGQIIGCLNIIGAHNALLDYENKRIFKDMRNQVNRLVNCETANLNKTVDAAVRQLENIKDIANKLGLEKLPYNLRQLAEARLNNPDASLRELGDMMEPRVGKSGISHRLKKIEELADKIK